MNLRYLYVIDGAGNVLDEAFDVRGLVQGDATIDADGDATIDATIPASDTATIQADGAATVEAEAEVDGDATIDVTGAAVIGPQASGTVEIGATGFASVFAIAFIPADGTGTVEAEGFAEVVELAVLTGTATIDVEASAFMLATLTPNGDAIVDVTGVATISLAPDGETNIDAEGDVLIQPQTAHDAAIEATGDVTLEAGIPLAEDVVINAEGAIDLNVSFGQNAAIGAEGNAFIELFGFEIRGQRIRADFYDAQGNAIGAGPVVDIIQSGYSLNLDEVGRFSLEIPATHEIVPSLTAGVYLRLYREGEGQVFRGIVHTPKIVVKENGQYVLQLQGDALARELVWSNTLFGREFSNTAMPAVINTLLSGTGWTATTATDSRNLTAQFEGVSIWKAITHSAEMFGWHVRDNNLTRQIEVGPFGSDSGLVLQNVTHVQPDMAVVPVKNLTITDEQPDLWNRVIPVGGGEGINRLTLQLSNRSSPYTIQSDTGPDGQPYWYIEDSASIAAHGLRVMPLSMDDVVPISNSTAEIRNAANALYDIAAAWLGWHATAHKAFQVEVAGLRHYEDDSPKFRVGDTARLMYRGVVTDADGETQVWQDIDETVYILGFDRTFTPNNINGWKLTVSTTDHRTPSDADVIAKAIDNLWAVKTSKRPYTYQDTYGPYVESVNSGNNARFLMRLDTQVTYLHKAMLTLRKRRVKSNVTGAAAGGGQTSSSGGGQTTSSGGGQTSSSSGSHTHSISSTTSSAGGGQTSSAGTAHSHTVSGQATSGGGIHFHPFGQANNVVSWATPSHRQQLILGTTPGGYNFGMWVGRDGTSPNGGVFFTDNTVNHTHTVTGTTSSSESSHTHSVSNHQHSVSGQTAASAGAHTHSVSNHTHTVSNHSHTISDHTHALVYGIFLGPTASAPQFNIIINGTNHTSALGGPWNNDVELDVTPYLVDGQGQPLRQSNNIDIQSSQLCDVELTLKAYVTSHSIVPV